MRGLSPEALRTIVRRLRAPSRGPALRRITGEAISGTSEICPAATPATSAYASSSDGSSSTPFFAQKTYIASHASRLLASSKGWIHASECSSAAAFVIRSGYASCPSTLARGRWTAASSRPMSRTSTGPSIARRAILRACSIVRWRVTPRAAAAAPKPLSAALGESIRQLVVPVQPTSAGSILNRRTRRSFHRASQATGATQHARARREAPLGRAARSLALARTPPGARRRS